jgi:NADH-quinone oxidoreductase subunit J
VSLSLFFFYLYAAIALAGAVGLVLVRSLVHAVMSLFATLIAIAMLYMLLGSQFLAAMQLFIYGGAVTVLVLFVLMLTKAEPEQTTSSRNSIRAVSLVLCGVFFVALAYILGSHTWEIAASHAQDTASLAEILFSRYVLPFEIAGLALTIALIGAIVLAREDDVAAHASEGGEQA